MKKTRLLSLLVLLLTAVTGAWADGQELKVKIISEEMATPWLQADASTKLTTKDLPDFYPVTEDEAMAWADVPQDGTVFLIYAFDDPHEGSAMHYVRFDDGEYKESYQQDGSIYSIALSIIDPYSNTDQDVKFYYTYAFSAKLAANTKDAKNWTIASGENSVAGNVEAGLTGLSEGDAVTLTYTGHLKLKGIKAATDAGPDPLATPLTIEAITAGKISVSNAKSGMQFSLDGGKTKNAVTGDDIALNAGDKVQFYGDGTSITSYGSNLMSECTMINGLGDGFTCKVYGNIMSLVDEENFAKAKTLSDKYTFKFLFYNNTKLTDASGLLLPATQLQESCYHDMFSGCTALAAAPALPATQLAAHCYNSMFNGCSALTEAPVLPATKLAMYCYYAMFNYCSKLATVTCLATSGINQDYSTSYWLNYAGSDVQGTKTVNTVSSANWPSGDNGIPTGWTRENIDN